MMRQLLVPSLLAVLIAPHWAAAFDPCVCPPVVVTHCPPVIVHAPLMHCTPTLGTIVAPPQKGPTIVPERTEPPAKKPEVNSDVPKTMPVKAEEPAKPAPLPPVKFEEPIKPVAVEPKQEPKQVVPPTDRITSPAVPPAPPTTVTKPALEKMEFDIPPIGDVPQAKPQPAEGTKPEAPKSPDVSKPAATAPKPPEKLPEFNFDLPKVEGGMAQPVEANKKTVANSSPLADKPVVDVYPRDGKDVVSAKRGVTFVNKSPRDVLLTVDGQTTTLASKTVLTVELPAAFKWQIGGEPERSEKVPDGSPGVDVVIRK